MLRLFWLGCAFLSVGVHANQKPHLIYLLVDDLGWNNVPWHGNKEATNTSSLMNLATKEGVILDRFYAYTCCSPTRSSFLSGRWPVHINIDNSPTSAVDLRVSMLPAKLKKAGYATAAFGKWHCGYFSLDSLPINRGFDHHFGFLTGSEDHFTQRRPGGKFVDLWYDHGPAYGKNGSGYSADLYGGGAADFIKSHPTTTPLFMYVAFQNTHEPYQVPNAYKDPEIPNSSRRTMQAMMSAVAEWTDNVYTTLKEREMWNNTLVIWSSDNGGPQYWKASNYPLRGGKGTSYEGGIRVAAFATGGLLAPSLRGKTVTFPFHITDVHYTFCKLAGLDDEICTNKVPDIPPTDGHDFSDWFLGNKDTNLLDTDRLIIPHEHVIISGKYKLIQNNSRHAVNYKDCTGIPGSYWTGPLWPQKHGMTNISADACIPDIGCPSQDGWCLYNVEDDMLEKEDLSEKEPEIKEKLRNLLEKARDGFFQTNTSDTTAQGYPPSTCNQRSAIEKYGDFLGPWCYKNN